MKVNIVARDSRKLIGVSSAYTKSSVRFVDNGPDDFIGGDSAVNGCSGRL